MQPCSPPRRILGPARLPVPVEQVKAPLRLAGIADHDEEVERLIVAAVDLLDGHRGLLGYALERQTWEATYPALAGVLELPLGPVAEVVSITWWDGTGAAQVVAPADYALDAAAGTVAAVEGWPDLGHAAMAAARPVVRWVAGVGCGAAEAGAIAALVRHWFDGGVGVPRAILDQLPRRLLAV
ncbi:MAG: hypothetical protein BWX69_03052 [Planctomycetes bacterium ADurb.Bin069]|nr:MAG: hypothetical protein BWX69_03052 [Planctomycetes bacterium ADurb.Bin069]